MKNPVVITFVMAVIVGALSFYGGMQYQKSRVTSQFANARRSGNTAAQVGNYNRGSNVGVTPTNNEFQGRMGAGRPVMGEITAVDDASITVKNIDGNSTIVVLGESTKVTKSADASKSDLKVGETVNVRGTEDSSGTVTAESISLTEPFAMQ